jgi:hypothetical protein
MSKLFGELFGTSKTLAVIATQNYACSAAANKLQFAHELKN